MAKSQNPQINPSTQLTSALSSGVISQGSHELLVENLDTVTTLGAQGVSADELPEDRVTLVVFLTDHTGSRWDQRDLMRSEYNRSLDALKKSKARDTILVSSWLFGTSSTLLHGFVKLDDAVRLDENNYNPDGATALFDAVLDVLTSTVAYAQSLIDQGYRVKIVLPILTDGQDNASDAPASDVHRVITDLLGQEIYVPALVAFGTGYATTAAHDMGIPPQNVIEFGKDDKDIRSAFSLVSSSVIRQSQTQVGGSTSFFS